MSLAGYAAVINRSKMLTVQLALTATGGLLASTLIMGIVSLVHPVCYSSCLKLHD